MESELTKAKGDKKQPKN